VTPRYNDIQQGGGGCLVCASDKANIEIVMATMLAADLKPLEPYLGAREPWLCRHKCGREVQPRYTHIQQGGGGCRFCASDKANMEIVMATMLAADLKPLEPYPGSHEPWLCRHACGNEVRPTYTSIQQGGGGCQSCASRWYDPSRPGCVYLIESAGHPNFPYGVIKIGMAGGQSQRLDQWRQKGWTLLDVFHFDDGKIPPIVEREVLEWFNKDLGLEPCLSAADLGTRGYTETISVADLTQAGVSLTDVRKKIKQLVKKSGGQFTASANPESTIDLGNQHARSRHTHIVIS
jgi:Fe-S cluster biogenesis protein NfuA